MSLPQTAAGIGIVALVASFATDSLLPPVSPIVVHSLTYSDGEVRQDRSVTAEGDVFFARWAAVLVNADTGHPVPWCGGGGSWPYTVGRIAASLPLDVWVGDERCTPESLSPGRYYPLASWYWGADETSHRGDVFVIE